jgi:hypothetical protein
MRKIKLTQGQFALVDNEMFLVLNQFKWHAHKNKGFRVVRNIRVRNKRTILPMARFIMGTQKVK